MTSLMVEVYLQRSGLMTVEIVIVKVMVVMVYHQGMMMVEVVVV